MRIGELARRSGVTTKEVRYYESLGLLDPSRLSNGYRDYDEGHLRAVTEIRQQAATGITARQAAPFVDCLALGHEHGDDCVSSLAAYRQSIAGIDQIIATLQARRARLVERLDEGASRTFKLENPMTDFSTLPDNLPVPVDNGAADHLSGLPLPQLTLPASNSENVSLTDLPAGRSVICLYPLTGRPGSDLPEGWDSIPGARGCSTEACDFRDHFQDLHAAGATAVYGLSNQNPQYQSEVVHRFKLPFTMLSDEYFRLAEALSLPTFQAEGHARLYSRLTLIVRDGQIEHVFYPIFPPNTHAQQVLTWLHKNPA